MSKPDPHLAAELFALVEFDQGKAFISDGMGNLSRAEIIKVARMALRHTEVTADHLRSFLSRFNEGSRRE